MLVGGGSESNGGWSDTPYSWLVENAPNKKIGIISYSEADDWLPNYFKGLGDVEADNIYNHDCNVATVIITLIQ